MKKNKDLVIAAAQVCIDESERFDNLGFKTETMYMVEVNGVLHALPRIYTAYCELLGMFETRTSNHGKRTISYKLFDELGFNIEKSY